VDHNLASGGDGLGGGIYEDALSILTLTGVTVEYNLAIGGAAGLGGSDGQGIGGGLYLAPGGVAYADPLTVKASAHSQGASSLPPGRRPIGPVPLTLDNRFGDDAWPAGTLSSRSAGRARFLDTPASMSLPPGAVPVAPGALIALAATERTVSPSAGPRRGFLHGAGPRAV
jgi:hypothetical protein